MQAPHCAMPQPNFVPVSRDVSQRAEQWHVIGRVDGDLTSIDGKIDHRLLIPFFAEPEIARDCVPMIFSRYSASVDRDLATARRTFALSSAQLGALRLEPLDLRGCLAYGVSPLWVISGY